MYRLHEHNSLFKHENNTHHTTQGWIKTGVTGENHRQPWKQASCLERSISEPRCEPTTPDSRCGGIHFYRCATNHHKIFENLRQTHETIMLWDLSPTFTIRFMLVQDGLQLSSQSTGFCFVFMFSPSPFQCCSVNTSEQWALQVGAVITVSRHPQTFGPLNLP